MSQSWAIAVTVVAGFVVLWVGLLLVLAVARPKDLRVSDALRLLPDTIVLLGRLVADRDMPRGVRIPLFLLLLYLVSPIDLVPDFIPVIGYADDAIITAIALRSVIRHAGAHALDEHWPGTPAGLQAVRRFARMSVRS